MMALLIVGEMGGFAVIFAGFVRPVCAGEHTGMDPVAALRKIVYYKDRDRQDPRRVMAYRNAADIVEDLDDAERERHGQANSWQ